MTDLHTQTEAWRTGRPWRNANPGDLRPRTAEPPWPGQIGTDVLPGGPFAIFGTRVDGWCALGLWLMLAGQQWNLHTVRELISVFAPPSENNTQAYIGSVERRLGSDPLNMHDLATRIAMGQAIAHYEDARVPWPEGECHDGMLIAESRWPLFLQAAHPVKAKPASIATRLSDADRLNQAQLDRSGTRT